MRHIIIYQTQGQHVCPTECSPIDINQRFKAEEGARVVCEELGQEGGARAPGGQEEDVEWLGVGQRLQGSVWSLA